MSKKYHLPLYNLDLMITNWKTTYKSCLKMMFIFWKNNLPETANKNAASVVKTKNFSKNIFFCEMRQKNNFFSSTLKILTNWQDSPQSITLLSILEQVVKLDYFCWPCSDTKKQMRTRGEKNPSSNGLLLLMKGLKKGNFIELEKVNMYSTAINRRNQKTIL